MSVRRWGGPVAMMMLAALFALLCAVSAVVLALAPRSLGLALAQNGSGVAIDIDHSRNAAAVVAAFDGAPIRPVHLAALGPATGGESDLKPLVAEDLTAEPDALPNYRAVAAFFDRQTALSRMLAAGPVVLVLRDAADVERRVVMAAETRRELTDLPAVFWFQLAVGVIGLLLSCWVWALRPGDRGAQLFALVGLSMVGFTMPAAVYSTRELALDGGLFRVLSDMNAAGAMTFGAAMIGVFLRYPRRIGGPALLAAPFIIFGGWLLAHLLRLPEGHGDGAHLPTLLEMLLILVAIAAQWRATRRDPLGRAALRWLGVSVTVGAGAFVALMSVPVLTGAAAPIPQGYAFGFFLLIHAGLTLGLRRYRLFELGEWAFRVMLAAFGLFALLALDMALVLALHLEHNVALSLSLLAVGFLYLPMRDWLMRRLVGGRTVPDHELFGMVMEVAFVAEAEARAAAWLNLLRRLFDPLELQPIDSAPQRVCVDQEGLALEIPATAGAPALRLRWPQGGRGLFTPAQLAMATRLCELTARAESGREAYSRGAAAERRRIARDLHDDLGARLLAAMRQSNLERSRGMVREAMADVRTIVSGLSGERSPLGRVLGDLRHETAQRLEGTGVALDWPVSAQPEAWEALAVDYAVRRALTATLREAVSNALRHAAAANIAVSARWDGREFALSVSDDGAGFEGRPPAEGEEPRAPRRGFGLENMAARLNELNGRLDISPGDQGTMVKLVLPLKAPSSALNPLEPTFA